VMPPGAARRHVRLLQEIEAAPFRSTAERWIWARPASRALTEQTLREESLPQAEPIRGRSRFCGRTRRIGRSGSRSGQKGRAARQEASERQCHRARSVTAFIRSSAGPERSCLSLMRRPSDAFHSHPRLFTFHRNHCVRAVRWLPAAKHPKASG
jgi:hypothetical protein